MWKFHDTRESYTIGGLKSNLKRFGQLFGWSPIWGIFKSLQVRIRCGIIVKLNNAMQQKIANSKRKYAWKETPGTSVLSPNTISYTLYNFFACILIYYFLLIFVIFFCNIYLLVVLQYCENQYRMPWLFSRYWWHLILPQRSSQMHIVE